MSIKCNNTDREEERNKMANMIACANDQEQRLLGRAVRSFAIQA